jgi:hypothetical protein
MRNRDLAPRRDAVWRGVDLGCRAEVAAAGQTSQLELFNLTAGTRKTAIEHIALPSGDRWRSRCRWLMLYSVRLRRSGGTASQIVSCRSNVLSS